MNKPKQVKKKSLAKKLLEEQQRIENSQYNEPFIKKVILEPQVKAEIRQRSFNSNPYYKAPTEESFSEQSAKINLLKSAGIYLPPGYKVDSIQARDYINQKLQQLSDLSGKAIYTIMDLIVAIESGDEKILKALDSITLSSEKSANIFQSMIDKETEEKYKKLDEALNPPEVFEEKEEEPILISLNFEKPVLERMKLQGLKNYAKQNLGISRVTGVTKAQLIERILAEQNRLSSTIK